MVCTQIAFKDSGPQGNCSFYNFTQGTYRTTDGFAVSMLLCPLVIVPHDSMILTGAMVGSCLLCTEVQARSYSDQCIIKAIFIPNKGARDSAVFIGPRISGGTKFATTSKVISSDKVTSAMKLYDLSGRCVDKMTGRKHGVYIATYGRQGVLTKKILISN